MRRLERVPLVELDLLLHILKNHILLIKLPPQLLQIETVLFLNRQELLLDSHLFVQVESVLAALVPLRLFLIRLFEMVGGPFHGGNLYIGLQRPLPLVLETSLSGLAGLGIELLCADLPGLGVLLPLLDNKRLEDLLRVADVFALESDFGEVGGEALLAIGDGLGLSDEVEADLSLFFNLGVVFLLPVFGVF